MAGNGGAWGSSLMTSPGISALISTINRHANQAQSTEEERRWSGSQKQLLSVRVPEEILDRLDRLERKAKAAGVPHASRSWIVREALTSFLDGVEEEVDLSDSADNEAAERAGLSKAL